MKNFPDQVKIQLFASFAANEKKIGVAQIEQVLAKTDSKDVRIAGFRALAVLGDKSTAQLLAGYAAQVSDRDEKKQAREALYRLSGKNVDAAILHKIASAFSDSEVAMIAELIRATADRPIPSAYGVLLKMARSANRKISSASIRALQTLATPEQLNDLIDLLMEMPGSATEKAVIVVGNKIEDPNRRAQALLAQYGSMTSENIKVSMLHVLGKLGDQKAVALLKNEFSSTNPKIKEAAFRTMTDWPADDFREEMKTLAQSGLDTKTKILALRAYLRMLDASVDKNQSQIVEELIAAYPMAQRPEERKIVIGTLGHYGNLRALDFVQKALTDPGLKAEAQVSLIQICEKLLTRNPLAVKPVLQNLKNTSTIESVKTKAGELFEKFLIMP